MEKMPEPRRETLVNKIHHRDKELEEVSWEFFQEEHKDPPSIDLNRYQLENSAETEKMIEGVVREMEAFLAEFGVQMKPIGRKNILVVDYQQVTDDLRSKYSLSKENGELRRGGYFDSHRQVAVIFHDSSSPNKLQDAQNLVHELLHAQAFLSYQEATEDDAHVNFTVIDDENQRREDVWLKIRRFGNTIPSKTDQHHNYFLQIEEAVIQELAFRFELDHFKNIPELEQALQEKNEFISELPDEEYDEKFRYLAWGTKEEKKKRMKGGMATVTTREFLHYPYTNFRKRLRMIAEEMSEKLDKEPEDIFQAFVDASLKGRPLRVARMIERTYGKGGYRKMGEQTTQPFRDGKHIESDTEESSVPSTQ